jgi:hypothetical protein
MLLMLAKKQTTLVKHFQMPAPSSFQKGPWDRRRHAQYLYTKERFGLKRGGEAPKNASEMQLERKEIGERKAKKIMSGALGRGLQLGCVTVTEKFSCSTE